MEKKNYFFNITEVKENNETVEVMNFNFGGHHDLAEVAEQMKAFGVTSDKHAKELACGLRLMHHALKKYPENELMANFYQQLNAFKKAVNERTMAAAH